MSSKRETQSAFITLGPSRILITFPRRLGDWFAGLSDQASAGTPTSGWAKLEENSSERFRVKASSGRKVADLGLGDALAAFWEQVTFLLVDRLSEALALHAAAVFRGADLVLIPGASGAGKTQLSLWYGAQGFSVATDELTTLSSPENSQVLLAGTLARPLFTKSMAAPAALAPQESLRVTHGLSGGEVVKIASVAAEPPHQVGAGFLIFPRFEARAPLQLAALTPAQAGMRLLEHCVNIRNMPRSGLHIAAAVARRMPAVSLHYGETRQLDGALDVMTRQVLAAAPDANDLAALCDSFSARVGRNSTFAVATAECAPQLVAAATQPVRRLTIGMATFDEYDGVYFTVQSIRLHHPEIADTVEFIVVDNNPGGPCSEALKQLGTWMDGYRYVPRGDRRGTAIRDVVFEEASCEIVLCVDPHVLIMPGALSRLLDYFQATPTSRDLLQGPLVYDDLRTLSTHFAPGWRAGMYGTWEFDKRGADPNSPAFEIPMQGLGLFACRRDAWPGFNPNFRGFGGEEGYIHEKFRRRGGRTLCLPFLRWLHRFGRPFGTPYPNIWEDRIRNYLIGFTELGLDTASMKAHFAELLGAAEASRIFAEIWAAMPSKELPVKNQTEGQSGHSASLTWSPSEVVYSPHNFSFGDQWATVNYYLNMSVMKQQRIRLASLLNGVNLHRLHREILAVLDSSGQVEPVLREPTVGLNGYNVWSSPYFPTKRRWDPLRRHKYVCVQFDGQSAPNATNPSVDEEQSLRTFLKTRCPGLETVDLGKHLSVQECVDIAADSALFVGVDSGMSHLCHSVGVPVFLLEYGLPTITTHAGKAHTLCRGFEDFVGRFDRHVEYLHAAGSPDAFSIRKAHDKVATPVVAIAAADVVDQAFRKAEPETGIEIPLPERSTDRHLRIRRILSLLTPHAVSGASKIRIGSDHDGGYVMIDDLRNVRICYSLGIGSDVNWDYDMAQRGAEVFQYDHSVAAPPRQHWAFHFRQLAIAPSNNGIMRTVDSLLDENGHAGETEMIMKMDIEGAEWDVLDNVSFETLGRFRQLVCEFHGFSSFQDPVWSERAERVLRKLTTTHTPVHVHGNNFARFDILDGVPIPDVLEVTFVRRSSYSFERSIELLPGQSDRPNRPDTPDFYLGRFEF